MIVRLYTNGPYWSAKWSDALGRRHSRGLGRKDEVSEREALRKCRAIQADQEQFSGAIGKAPTLGAWGEKYLSLRGTALSSGTLYLHKLTLKYLADHFGDATKIDRINRVHAAEWRVAISAGRSPQTVALNIRNAKVIFQTAVDLALITANPFAKENGAAPAVDKDWRQIDAPDFQKLLAACPDDPWRCLFALARWAGLRLGECLRLRWEHIDWDRKTLQVVHQGEISTKKRSRTVPIRPDLFKLLAAAFEAAAPGSDGPTDGTGRYNTHAKAARICARSIGEYAKPFHTLRKCCESEWMAEYPVLDVAAWLGHSPTVAARHYVRTADSTMARVTGHDLSRNRTKLDTQPTA